MVVVKIRWWFIYLYLPGVFAMCRLLDYFGIEYEPNWQRIEFWAVRAVTVEQKKQGKHLWKLKRYFRD